MDRSQRERLLVFLVALHSIGVGIVLLAVPRWAASFGGWGDVDSVFFIRQGGIFHVVVAVGYVMEFSRHRTVGLMLVAKSMATGFLVLSWLGDPQSAWALPFAALGDGFMAVLAFLIHRRARRTS